MSAPGSHPFNTTTSPPVLQQTGSRSDARVSAAFRVADAARELLRVLPPVSAESPVTAWVYTLARRLAELDAA